MSIIWNIVFKFETDVAFKEGDTIRYRFAEFLGLIQTIQTELVEFMGMKLQASGLSGLARG